VQIVLEMSRGFRISKKGSKYHKNGLMKMTIDWSALSPTVIWTYFNQVIFRINERPHLKEQSKIGSQIGMKVD
jgi:hypothetical protein